MARFIGSDKPDPNQLIHFPMVTTSIDDFLPFENYITTFILPKRTYHDDGLSPLTFSDLHRNLDITALESHFPDWVVTTAYASLINSKYRGIINCSQTGSGKTIKSSLAFHEYFAEHPNQHLISFAFSRPSGIFQQQEYNRLGEYLFTESLPCYTYFSNQADTNRLLRNGKRDYSALLFTVGKFLGSLNYFSPIYGNTTESINEDWIITLCNPSVIFIDELDAFPRHQLPTVCHLIRLLTWLQDKKPVDQRLLKKIVLSSASIGNPDLIAQRFFCDTTYQYIFERGRRGEKEVNIWLEKKDEKGKLLLQGIKYINQRIHEENTQVEEDPTYRPKKFLLFINDKEQIERLIGKGLFNEHYLIIHADEVNKDPGKLRTILQQFSEEPTYLCLVATEIIHAGMNIHDIVEAIFYGFPYEEIKSNRKFQQLVARVARNPLTKGYIYLIIREGWEEEKLLADDTILEDYITNDDPVPLVFPYLTSRSLKL